jgi:hypothetical protein
MDIRARAKARANIDASSDIKSRVAALKDAWLRGGEKCKSSMEIHASKDGMSRKVKVDMLRVHDANEKLMVYSWNRRKRRDQKILGQNQRTQSEGSRMHVLPDENSNSSYMCSPEPDGERADSAEGSMIHSYEEGTQDEYVMEEPHLNEQAMILTLDADVPVRTPLFGRKKSHTIFFRSYSQPHSDPDNMIAYICRCMPINTDRTHECMHACERTCTGMHNISYVMHVVTRMILHVYAHADT